MFNYFNNRKLPKAAREAMKPRKVFMEKARTRFLAFFDASPLGARAAAHGVGGFMEKRRLSFLKLAAACGAFVAMFLGGVSVYADTANVSADSAFYPFKRWNENVQLVLASPPAKARLRASFAVRRAAEIRDISSRRPTSALLARLSSDLGAEVDRSVSAARENNLESDGLDDVCGKIYSAIATSSLAMHGELSIRPAVFLRLERVCSGEAASVFAPVPTLGASGHASGSIRAMGAARSKHGEARDEEDIWNMHNEDEAGAHATTTVSLPFRSRGEWRVRGGGSLNVIIDAPQSKFATASATSMSASASETAKTVEGNGFAGSDGGTNQSNLNGNVQMQSSDHATLHVIAPAPSASPIFLHLKTENDD